MPRENRSSNPPQGSWPPCHRSYVPAAPGAVWRPVRLRSGAPLPAPWDFSPAGARYRWRSGLSLTELLTVIGVVSVFGFVLLPTLSRARKLAKRAVCAANVREIIRSMVSYAQVNHGDFPSAATAGTDDTVLVNGPTAPGWLAAAQGGKSLWFSGQTAKAVIKQWYSPQRLGTFQPLAGPWLMALEGYIRPVKFICPSDPIAKAPSLEYSGNGKIRSANGDFGAIARNQGSGWGFMFNYGRGISYSFAVPWGWNTLGWLHRHPGEWWATAHANGKVPLVSDMAPADGSPHSGWVVNNDYGAGQGVCQRITTTLPTANTYGPSIYNSGNHAGDGQNVGFGDDHVAWETSPYVGENGDNIFTYSTAAGVIHDTTDTNQVGLSYQHGGWGQIVRIRTIRPPFDTCMMPVRTVNPKTAAAAWNAAY